MKTLTILAALLIGTAASAETIIIDGCEVKLRAGTNYYNKVDPSCKGTLAIHGPSKGEDARAERLAAAEKPAKH